MWQAFKTFIANIFGTATQTADVLATNMNSVSNLSKIGQTMSQDYLVDFILENSKAREAKGINYDDVKTAIAQNKEIKSLLDDL